MSFAGEVEKLVPGGLLRLLPIVLPLLTGKPNPPAPPAASGAVAQVPVKAQEAE
jgi:hypothetical protein